MNTLVSVNAGLVGLFAFAALHYGVKWWYARDERVLLLFSIQCLSYAAASLVIASYFSATTVADAQASLNWIVTFGAICHAVVLHYYARLGNRSDRGFRWFVTAVVASIVVLSLFAPLRGTVIELRNATLPWGGTGWLPVLTPPGAPLALLHGSVIVIHGYGLFIGARIWKRDRAGGALVVTAALAIIAGAVMAVLIDFVKVRAPYVGALPHAVFVVLMALYLGREYAARGARLVASEKRVATSLQETRQALASLEEEQRRLEESEAAHHRAMEAVVHAQRKDLASQLARGVAHDFINVLDVMYKWSRQLLDGTLLPNDFVGAHRALSNAHTQGQVLSRQLIALAEPEGRVVKQVALEPLINATMQTLALALPHSVKLVFEALPGMPEVEADEAEIRQVMYNLVLNARDAMPNGGTIRVTGGFETLSTTRAVVGGSLGVGRWATLSVADTGPGIDAAIRERIFDLFFSTKGENGTGIGLATVLRIANASGGGIALESVVGAGATFKVYLPAFERGVALPARGNHSPGMRVA